jgi:hypothetical protein
MVLPFSGSAWVPLEREVEGQRGVRSGDALNLAAVSGAPVLVSAVLLDDYDRRQADDSPAARLLRLAPAVPQMTVARAAT